MVIILSSCGKKNRQTDPATTINLDNLEEEAPALVDKLVEIEGTVIHVCRESGKRFFLGESQFKVLASSNIGRFNVGLEGSDIKVPAISEKNESPNSTSIVGRRSFNRMP